MSTPIFDAFRPRNMLVFACPPESAETVRNIIHKEWLYGHQTVLHILQFADSDDPAKMPRSHDGPDFDLRRTDDFVWVAVKGKGHDQERFLRDRQCFLNLGASLSPEKYLLVEYDEEGKVSVHGLFRAEGMPAIPISFDMGDTMSLTRALSVFSEYASEYRMRDELDEALKKASLPEMCRVDIWITDSAAETVRALAADDSPLGNSARRLDSILRRASVARAGDGARHQVLHETTRSERDAIAKALDNVFGSGYLSGPDASGWDDVYFLFRNEGSIGTGQNIPGIADDLRRLGEIHEEASADSSFSPR